MARLLSAVPVFHSADSRRSERFYCDQLGFRLEFATRAGSDDPCYMGVSRDGIPLHLSSFRDDSITGAVAFIRVENVDALHAEFVARHVPIDTPPVDQTWGNREMYVRDPDNNCLRFITPIRK